MFKTVTRDYVVALARFDFGISLWPQSVFEFEILLRL